MILNNHCSMSSFLRAHHTTSLHNPSKAFSKALFKCKVQVFLFAKYFSFKLLKVKVVFAVPHPGIKPNCILSLSTCCLINIPVTLSFIFRI